MKLIKPLITSCLLVFIILGACYLKNKVSNQKGLIVLITGPSSSGKTTIARRVQHIFATERFPIPFLYLSEDHFVSSFPDEYVCIHQAVDQPTNKKELCRSEGLMLMKELKTPEEISAEKNESSHYYKEPLPYKVVVKSGTLIEKLTLASPGVIKALSDQGINIILDMGAPAHLLKKALNGYPLSLITITAPTSILEEREDKNPTTRIRGNARERNKLNFTEGADFIIPNDTSEKNWVENLAPNEIVDWILNHYSSHFDHEKD